MITALCTDMSPSLSNTISRLFKEDVMEESYVYEHDEQLNQQNISPSKTESVVTVPRTALSIVKQKSTFTAYQKWVGYVTDIREDTFVARLSDLKNKGTLDEEAEIYCDKVSPEDKELLRLGAVFYWSIGYSDDVSGQRRNESLIRFRRLPNITRHEIERARKEADAICQAFGWD